MVSGAKHRDWFLVAPWYRWPRQREEHGWRPRETRPVFQKYSTSDPVSEFLKDPQKSLKFGTDDLVHALAPFMGNGNGKGRKRRLADGELVPTSLRKLYLPIHQRFYLVVCELRADGPGFPCVPRDEVCEAGFVVRRRTTIVPPELKKEAAELLKELALAQAQLAHVQELAAITSPALGKYGGAPAGQVIAALKTSVGEQVALQRMEAELAVKEKHAELAAWAAANSVTPVLQGWIPSEFEGIGSWQQVEDKPSKITEQVYPLYPLITDPERRCHSGYGHNIYFGLVPTMTQEADAYGNARFDDRELYEIRCFVRRHKPGCPKKSGRNDCNGELVWSAPTEPYRIAPHFDLTGTSNRPITIQLPDIPALAAQAAASPVGANAPVRMISPPGSALKFRVEDGVPKKTGEPGASICSFSIPLITIIATFVLNLFLPVVVFVFGLWFMLRLKFCIPPSLEVGAGVTAALELQAGGIDIDANVGIDVDLDPGPGVLTQRMIQDEVEANMNAAFDATFGGKTLGEEFVAEFSPSVLVTQNAELARDFEKEPLEEAPFTARLQYEERVEKAEVFV